MFSMNWNTQNETKMTTVATIGILRDLGKSRALERSRTYRYPHLATSVSITCEGKAETRARTDYRRFRTECCDRCEFFALKAVYESKNATLHALLLQCVSPLWIFYSGFTKVNSVCWESALLFFSILNSFKKRDLISVNAKVAKAVKAPMNGW